MRELSNDEIEMFASRVGVRRIAVENFLSTLGQAGGMSNELRNLGDDAKSFKWNKETVKAIKDGIILAYRGKQ
jgi:hypothetical protein